MILLACGLELNDNVDEVQALIRLIQHRDLNRAGARTYDLLDGEVQQPPRIGASLDKD